MARILVADPDVLHLNELATAIRATDIGTVEVVASGTEAVARLRMQAFDLAMIELSLPPHTGLEVLHELRRSRRETRAIIYSGSGNMKAAVKAAKLGAYDFWEKPLNMLHVGLMLRRIVEGR